MEPLRSPLSKALEREMISLRPLKFDELETINQLDKQSHARKFVNGTGIKTHQISFNAHNINYLSIENNSTEFCGYFILVEEPNTGSIEFRRVIIDQTKRGIGQVAITEMERYCKRIFNVSRIWLDVYEDNEIGLYIYKKMGYKWFKEESVEGRMLYFYEKTL